MAKFVNSNEIVACQKEFLRASHGGSGARYQKAKRNLEILSRELGYKTIAHLFLKTLANVSLGKDEYLNWKNKNGLLEIFYGGLRQGGKIVQYGHVVVELKGRNKKKIVVTYHRRPFTRQSLGKKYTLKNQA